MPAPWEKYQQADEGPWLKYQVPPPPSGIPDGASQAGQDARDMGASALNFAKKAALPTVGSMALPIAGTALAGPANAPFIPLEQGIGSGLGEAANQLAGITEPSLTQIGIATVAPIVTGYGMNLLRTGTALPATLQTKASEMATSQVRGYRSAVPAKDLFEQAAQQGSLIPLTKTEAALNNIRARLVNATPAGQKAFEKVAADTGIDDLVKATTTMNVSRLGPVQNPGINPVKMQYVLGDVGKLQGEATGMERGYLSEIFGALKDDLEASGSGLATARQAWKRETVLNDLEDAIKSAMFTKKGAGLQTEFSANKIINTLNKTDEGLGKFFVQSFTPKERSEIMSLMGFLNELPSLKPGAGQQYGSGQFWNRLSKAGAGGSIGAGTGFLVGGPAGAAIGGGAGILANEATDITRLVMQAWKMPGGRSVVKQLLTNSDGAALPYVASTLSAFLSSATAKRPSIPTQGSMTTIQPMPNDAGGSIYDYPPVTNMEKR